MTTLLATFTLLISTPQLSIAGGNSSIVELDEPTTITIGYQRDKMTITSVYVTNSVGSGSLRGRKPEKDQSGAPTAIAHSIVVG